MTFEDIALKVTQDIAQVATDLYNAATITENLKIVIYDDINRWDYLTKVDSEDYVPGTLKVQQSVVSDSHMTEDLNLSLWFYCPLSKRDIIQAILDEYRQQENNEGYDVIDDSIIAKTVQRHVLDTDRMYYPGQSDEYVAYRLDFKWTITSGLTGIHGTLNIDTVAVPFISIDNRNDKVYVGNKTTGTNQYETEDSVEVRVPLDLENAKISALYDDVSNNSHNKTYALEWVIGSKTTQKTLVLKTARYIISKNSQIVGMILVFSSNYPRANVKIDDVDLDIVDYQYDLTRQTTPKREGAVNKVEPTELTRNWSLVIVNDGSAKFLELWAEIENPTHTYELKVTKNSVLYTYDVVVVQGAERFTETPQSITLKLQELKA